MRQHIKAILLSEDFAQQYVKGVKELFGEDYFAHDRNLAKSVFEYYTTLLSVVNAFDDKTKLHLNLSEEIAEFLGTSAALPAIDLIGLSLGAMMHDIGKIGIDHELITRPGPITAEERKFVETHTIMGSNILSHITTPWAIGRYALMHHERLDGSGYPNGLTADQIPLEIRILSVADVSEALMANRPYRSPWTHTQVLDYLNEHPEWFDTDIVKYFEKYKV